MPEGFYPLLNLPHLRLKRRRMRKPDSQAQEMDGSIAAPPQFLELGHFMIVEGCVLSRRMERIDKMNPSFRGTTTSADPPRSSCPGWIIDLLTISR
jgi:hypothetical protein